jgi:hypothetical protein
MVIQLSQQFFTISSVLLERRRDVFYRPEPGSGFAEVAMGVHVNGFDPFSSDHDGDFWRPSRDLVGQIQGGPRSFPWRLITG